MAAPLQHYVTNLKHHWPNAQLSIVSTNQEQNNVLFVLLFKCIAHIRRFERLYQNFHWSSRRRGLWVVRHSSMSSHVPMSLWGTWKAFCWLDKIVLGVPGVTIQTVSLIFHKQWNLVMERVTTRNGMWLSINELPHPPILFVKPWSPTDITIVL
jgi:hypothetical protein